MRVGSALGTGSQMIACDRCGGHACPHAYRLRLAGETFDLCGACLEQTSQILFDYCPQYAGSLAEQFARRRAEREAG
jgi:hypothetical protein